MKKSLIHLAVLAALAGAASVGRARTHDVAFTFRMGAGYPGEVNRTHPFSVYARRMNQVNPVRLFGDPGLYDAASATVRGFIAGDTATKIAGVLVRPYPTQQASGGMSAAFGVGAPPLEQPADILEEGAIMVKCNDFGVAPSTLDGAVHVRITASSGNKIQGGFHAAADGVNTVAITNARWNGAPDASGIAELIVWKA